MQRAARISLWTMATAAVAACGGRAAPRAPMHPAGHAQDDASGQLARASVEARKLEPVELAELSAARPIDPSERYGGFLPGAATGGVGYGGSQRVDPPQIERDAYRVQHGFEGGAITGRVTWPRPPVAAEVRTACGALPRTAPRLGPGGGVSGAIVFVAAIEQGKPWADIGPVVRVGGVVTRDGCGLWPRAQLLLPAPASLEVSSGSAEAWTLTTSRTDLRGDGADATEVPLARGTAQVIAGLPGITTLADREGSLLPAYVVATPHPYITFTTADGSFRLDQLPPGSYDLVIWHPPVVVSAAPGGQVTGAPVVVQRRVTVTANLPTQIDIALP